MSVGRSLSPHEEPDRGGQPHSTCSSDLLRRLVEGGNRPKTRTSRYLTLGAQEEFPRGVGKRGSLYVGDAFFPFSDQVTLPPRREACRREPPARVSLPRFLGDALLSGVNISGAGMGRLDWTKTRLYSLSERRPKIIRGMNKPGAIPVFMDRPIRVYAPWGAADRYRVLPADAIEYMDTGRTGRASLVRSSASARTRSSSGREIARRRERTSWRSTTTQAV